MGNVVERRGKLYIMWYDGNGKRRQKATACTTERDALALIREKEAEAQKVRDGRLEQPLGITVEEKARRVITVRELAAHFVGDVEGDPGYAPPKIKSIASYRHDARKNVGRLPATFLDMPAARVRLLDVERVRDGLKVRLGVKPGDEPRALAGASVVQVLATVSKMFAWARKVGLVDCANPVQGVERPRAASSIDYLSHAEASGLLARAEEEATHAGADLAARVRWPMLAVAAFAGLRKGELFGLRWRDVNLEAARLDVLHSYELAPKSGKARHLPIHVEAARALRWWRDRYPSTPRDLLFPVEGLGGALRMGTKETGLDLDELLARAECHTPAQPWHAIRHTFASHFVMAGGNLLTLQRLLGHSTPTMTMRYAHLAPDFLSSEVARLDFTPKKPAKVSDLASARAHKAKRDRVPVES